MAQPAGPLEYIDVFPYRRVPLSPIVAAYDRDRNGVRVSFWSTVVLPQPKTKPQSVWPPWS